MELVRIMTKSGRLVLYLEDHGKWLQVVVITVVVVLLIWLLTQMDICLELNQIFMFIELYQIMVPGVSLLMEMLLI